MNSFFKNRFQTQFGCRAFSASFALLIAGLALLLAMPAQGQVGFDLWGPSRAVWLAAPTNYSGNAINIQTNLAVDLRPFTGIATVDVSSCTNANGGTYTVNFQTSPDQATWTALQNYAVAATVTNITTNMYYGSNLLCTNVYQLPGTFTTPTASTAGFATTYLDPAGTPFTNSGALTITRTGIYRIGFNVNDCGRYIRTYWTPGGTATNSTLSALLTGRSVSQGNPGQP